MKVTKIPGLGDYGIYIDDVNLHNMSDDEWLEIGHLYLKNLVTIIRNCKADKNVFGDKIAVFGETRHQLESVLFQKYKVSKKQLTLWAFSDKESPLSEDDKKAIRSIPQFRTISDTGRNMAKVCGGYNADGTPKGLFADGELEWHSNESGTLTFTPGVALFAVENVVGSATGFVTTTDYYESVSESFRSELDDMVIVHKFTPGKINPGLNEYHDAIMRLNMCPNDDTKVPLVIQSPGGIKGLHYSINTINSIEGCTEKESKKIFDKINNELFVEKYQYDHWYKNNNDLLLFDNSITLHRRLGNIEDRLCYRIAHDYSNIQGGPYQPYFQPEYANRYIDEITEVVKVLKIENFPIPNKV